MGEGARAADEDVLTCAKCHSSQSTERVNENGRSFVKCTNCGHTRDLLTSVAPGKWTVVDPSGAVLTFVSWEELVRAVPSSQVTAVHARTVKPIEEEADREPPLEEPKKKSGSALLDVTPSSTLALTDSVDPLAAATPVTEEKTEEKEEAKAAEKEEGSNEEKKEEAETKEGSNEEKKEEEKKEEEKKEPAAAARVKSDPPGLTDDAEQVLSVRDLHFVPVPPLHKSTAPMPKTSVAPPLIKHSLAPATPKDSLAPVTPKDSLTPREGREAPPPPARGTLKTLPLTRVDALPPPTILIADHPKRTPKPEPEVAEAKKKKASVEDAPEAKPKKKKASVEDAPAKAESESESDRTRDTTKTRRLEANKDRDKANNKDSRERPTRPPAAKAADQEKSGRSWFLPALVIFAAAIGILYFATRNSKPPADTKPASSTSASTNVNVPATTNEPTTPPPPTSATETTTSEPPTIPTPTPLSTNVPPVPPNARTVPTDSARPPETATSAPRVNEGALSLSELLDRAHTAKRAGDFTNANEYYERALRTNGGNVEAHGGLGDIAKAQGDLAAAKQHYSQALATSPGYSPAILGLADAEWDLGERASAQARYSDIVRRMGANAPARAKERSGK